MKIEIAFGFIIFIAALSGLSLIGARLKQSHRQSFSLYERSLQWIDKTSNGFQNTQAKN
jgi:hypothetical protein